MFHTDPIVSPADAHNRWRLLEPLVYQDELHGYLIVHPGAETDGASIPRILWTLVGSPMRDSRVFRAAVIHDQLYCTVGLQGKLSRTSCDAIFRRALRSAGCPAHKAALYHAGVRSGGWAGWNRYARDPAQIEKEMRFITRQHTMPEMDASRDGK